MGMHWFTRLEVVFDSEVKATTFKAKLIDILNKGKRYDFNFDYAKIEVDGKVVIISEEEQTRSVTPQTVHNFFNFINSITERAEIVKLSYSSLDVDPRVCVYYQRYMDQDVNLIDVIPKNEVTDNITEYIDNLLSSGHAMDDPGYEVLTWHIDIHGHMANDHEVYLK